MEWLVLPSVKSCSMVFVVQILEPMAEPRLMSTVVINPLHGTSARINPQHAEHTELVMGQTYRYKLDPIVRKPDQYLQQVCVVLTVA